MGIAVTVIFQGHFEKEGYRLGRLAAGLYRMPPKPAAQESQSPGPHDARWRKELPQVLQRDIKHRSCTLEWGRGEIS